MSGTSILFHDPTNEPYEVYVARWIRSNFEMRDGLRKGLADIKAGRTTPWQPESKGPGEEPEETR